MADFDVVVVGAGNAAMCAALAAREQGASVALLEAAPQEESGGNSRYTAGLFRLPYDDLDQLKRIIPDLSDEEIRTTDFGRYTKSDFHDDMGRITQYRANPDMVELLVERASDTAVWMRAHGVRFLPAYGRQAFKVDGRFKFWGGAHIEAAGGGLGLVQSLTETVVKRGMTIHYKTRGAELLMERGRVAGVRAVQRGEAVPFRARAVVLASGGFEANAEWRTRCLGPGWDLAKVRGSRFNTGAGIKMALDIGAQPYGNWSGAHSVGWDRNAPEYGDLAVGDNFQKHSYPFGIIVNARGERFVDEGADFRNYTYVRYGRAVLEQPGHFAWQVFDAKVVHLLRDEYRIKQITKATANTLEELAAKLEDVDARAFLREVRAYNAAVRTDIVFNPNVKDGRKTEGLKIDKSNWANTIDTPPFEAYAITCGVTFTFGGLRIDTEGRVLDLGGEPIPGLFAAGELVGGLFYFNYPGGSGLAAGSVFGKIAGAGAGRLAKGD